MLELRGEDTGWVDILRLNADGTGFVAVYEPESVIEARLEFLDAVQRVVPEAFTSLLETDGDQKRIDEWQQRWYLTAEWCGFVAFHTANEVDPPPYFLYPEMQANQPFKPLPPPELPAFDPTRENWAAYVKRCGTLLAEYQRQSYSAPELQKFKPVEDRRSLRKHLAWLAAYQCLRAPISAIAEAADTERAAIDYGVKSAAKFIVLPLRRAKSSTPRGDDRKRLLDRLVAALAVKPQQ